MKKIVLMLTLIGLFKASLAQVSIVNPETNKINTTNRPDGRYLSTNGLVQYKMRSFKPQLAFNKDFNKADFLEWQNKVRIKLKELMSFPVTHSQPSPKLLSQIERKGYRVEKWEMYPQPGSVVPFLMLIPDGVSSNNPAPAVVCYPGSNRTKENLAGEPELVDIYTVPRHYEINEMAKFYVEQGIISIALDNPGIGETSDLESHGLAPNYDRSTFTRYLIDMGSNYLGLSALNGQTVLNWMKTLDFIDSNRTALSGHSLGTEPVMVLGVLNPDIKAIVFNDFLTNNIRRAVSSTKPNSTGFRPRANWLGHCIPGSWKWFDYTDLLASLAPISLLISEGGVTDDLNTVERAYNIMNSNNFVFHYYEKYKKKENRKDSKFISEGLSQDEFFEYANVDAPNHYFKAKIAIPWLVNVLSK